VIHTQRITGDQTIGCHRGRTFAQRFCPFDNLIENDPIQNFNRGKEEHKSGENEKCEHKKGELDFAIKEYQLASKKLPVAYLYLGNVHFQKNEFPKAETYYKKAIREEPKNADAHNNLAWLYYTRRENLGEGERLALRAIELNPAKEDIYRDTLEKIREWRKLQE
jgi:tetratricopeptide (TPR) repeat protein